MSHKLRIGTRGSQLALKQTNMVAQSLRHAHPSLEIEIVEILTSGDWKPSQGETRLMECKGGKGQFAHEIEQRILAGEIDCGVHSLKDMPSFLPQGLEINHFMKREDPRDVFLSSKYKDFSELPEGAVIGTSSLRRQAFILNKYPHLKIVPLRGNVATRIEKLQQGQVDATFLAMAGLVRLNLTSHLTKVLEVEEFLPACGQGIIGIEIRSGDDKTSGYLDAISCPTTTLVAIAERAVLQVLDGSCHTPVGAYATLNNGRMNLKCAVAKPDGSYYLEDTIEGPVTSIKDAVTTGQVLGHRMRPKLPEGIL
jgi:hydroxymethylbilane synthase